MISIADSSVLSAPNPMPIAAIQKEAIEELRSYPQVEMPLTHRFQDGVYMREIFMPKGTIVVGHVHKTKHYNILLSGKAMVSMNGAACKVVKVGDVIESDAGVQKWLYIEEDCRWMTVHANPGNSEDVAFLEERLVEMSPEFLAEKGSRTIDQFRMSVNQTLEKKARVSLCP